MSVNKTLLKTWLEKAIKQSKRYRALSDHIVLVTPQVLSEREISVLRQHYDLVLGECTVHRLECKESLSQEFKKHYYSQ